MAKKNDKLQVINNIQELNLEIDYDKLAEAIVKAKEKSENKANSEKRYMSKAFATMISIAFRGVAILMCFFTFAMICTGINMFNTFLWNDASSVLSNIFSMLFLVALSAIFVLYFFLLWKSAKEIEAETDRNYIVAVFSGIVSFAALIVALVALFKGVG